MAYKFKFQRILDTKEIVENAKKGEMAEKNKQISEVNIEIENLDNEYLRYKDEYNAKLQDGLNVFEMRIMNMNMKMFEDKRQRLTSKLEVLNQELEKIKGEYIEVMKDRKSFENLKEKDFEKHLEKERKEEEKLIDELVTFKKNKAGE